MTVGPASGAVIRHHVESAHDGHHRCLTGGIDTVVDTLRSLFAWQLSAPLAGPTGDCLDGLSSMSTSLPAGNRRTPLKAASKE